MVEDDEGVRELTREVLAARGYSVMAASSPREALELSTKQEVLIDLIITGVIMPGMSGREMAERIAEARPGLRILMMSGYAEPQIGIF